MRSPFTPIGESGDRFPKPRVPLDPWPLVDFVLIVTAGVSREHVSSAIRLNAASDSGAVRVIRARRHVDSFYNTAF